MGNRRVVFAARVIGRMRAGKSLNQQSWERKRWERKRRQWPRRTDN